MTTLLVAGCASSVGSSGETHFLCSTTVDCERHGAQLICVAGVCQRNDSLGAVAVADGGPDVSVPPSGGSDASVVSSAGGSFGALEEGTRATSTIRPPNGGGPSGGGPSDAGAPARSTEVGSDAGDAGHVDYALGGVTSDGRVVAATWANSAEQVVLIDPATGKAAFQGYLGDLAVWSFQFIYDDATRMAYALGYDAAQASYLYSFSLDTGQSTRRSLPGADGRAADCVLGGVTASGSIVATHWSGSPVMLIDPATGQRTNVGAFEGMANWQLQLAYDDASRTLYAIGDQGDYSIQYVYSLDLETGAMRISPLVKLEPDMSDYILGGLSKDKKLVAVYGNKVKEQVALVDPATGKGNVVGVLDDLENWENQTVYSTALGTLVAYGWSARGVGRVYTVQLDR
jgi:hypothetical protein